MSEHMRQEPQRPAGTSMPMTENLVDKRPAGHGWAGPLHLHLVALGLGVAVAATVVLWLLLGGGSGSKSPVPSGPTIVSQAQLERFAGSMDTPLYWAGPKPGFSYELTASSGRAWVRYLPAGVSVGDPRSDFLVVGTYKQPNSYANLERAVNRPGGVSRKIGRHGLMVYSSARPTSVYFGYAGADYQVEVYTHSSKTARTLVLSGKIVPVR